MPAAAVQLGAVDVVAPSTDIPFEVLKWFTLAAVK
jgi:chemotaxis response regulator CheB